MKDEFQNALEDFQNYYAKGFAHRELPSSYHIILAIKALEIVNSYSPLELQMILLQME